MRYLLLVFLLIGCSDYSEVQDNINEFTRECEELAQCVGKPYQVDISLTARTKFICKIKHSDITNAYLYAPDYFDIEDRPDFGYNFLRSAIEVCKMLKKKGDYSDKEQNVMYRYKQCVDLLPGNPAQKQACWEQYKKGDFHVLEEK